MKKISGATLLVVVVIAATLVLFPQFGETNRSLAQAPGETWPNLKVAFIGDQGVNVNAKAVLNLILTEGADIVLHQGDFGYGNESDPQRAVDWDDQINAILGDDFPYFGAVGNHDLASWPVYQQLLQDRLDRVADAVCTGDLGVMASCNYGGLFFILSGAGTMGGTDEHAAYIKGELAADESIWSVCSWHKNQRAMQVGSKTDAVGWGPYEECRIGGAIIATGHEHSYSRTKTLIDTENQTVDPNLPDRTTVKVGNGSSFVFVSGIGGQGIRNQDRCLPFTFPYGCKGEWAEIITTDRPDAQFGALFIEFNVGGDPRAANGYFKNINGTVVETFTLTVPGVIQTITGTVQDASGAIAGATVSTDNGQSATTDASGNYVLAHVLTGERTVTADAPGYAAQQQPATILDGGSAVVNFILGPADDFGSVKGKVREAGTGDRIGGALIEIVETSQSTTTNNGASYSFNNVVPVGSWTIRASKAGYESQEMPIQVLVSQTVVVNFDLSLESPGNIAPTADGKVVATDEDSPVVVLLSGSDPETCELLFSVVQAPAHGTLSNITGNACVAGSPNTDSQEATYTPDAGYNGSDFFTYITNDGTSDSNNATVSITVETLSIDMYVSDIEFESRTRGKNAAKHDERIVVTVRRDADGDGVEETDQVVGGAAITVTLTGEDGTTYGVYNGNTNTSGVYRTGFASNLPAQLYFAEVTALAHVSYGWNQDLDNLPDEQHAIPH